MAWLTACNDTNKIEVRGGPWWERRPQLDGSVGIGGSATVVEYQRLHTPVTIQYVGVDLDTASAYAANPTNESGMDVKAAYYDRDGGGGVYIVTIEVEVLGDWELVT